MLSDFFRIGRTALGRVACGAVVLSAVTLAGCGTGRPADVPRSAVLKAEGDDGVVYVAETEGTVWVTNTADNRIAYSSPVRRGDQISADPRSGKLRLNGRLVADRAIRSGNHRIFFQSGVRDAPPIVITPDEPRRPFPDAAPAGIAVPADRVVLVERPQGVPNAAAVRYDGTGPADFIADRDGTVWVVNASAGRVIYSALINRGDIVVVDPARNRLLLNTHPIANGEVPSGDRYRVFFAPQ